MNRDTSDVTGAFLAFGLGLLVTASEAALTLPDQTAPDRLVASFYAHHRAGILLLQGCRTRGRRAAGRLRVPAGRDPPQRGRSALLLALLACAPGRPAGGTTCSPMADDVPFLGIIPDL